MPDKNSNVIPFREQRRSLVTEIRRLISPGMTLVKRFTRLVPKYIKGK